MSENHVILADFAAVPLRRQVSQAHLVSYLGWLLASARCAAHGVTTAEAAAELLAEVQSKLRRYAIHPRHIARREFNAFPESEAALGQAGAPPELPPGFEELRTKPLGPALDDRMRRFETLAIEAFRKWYVAKRDAPDDLIHVTCSGYASPSPAQRLIAERGWYATSVTHSYHMGCYGAFPAIRTAVGLLAPSVLAGPEPKRRVDIVHTEYLSAHVATLKDAPADLIDMTLFGDGFIGYSAHAEASWRKSSDAVGLRVLACHEQLIPHSESEMSWRLGPHHFDMVLSKQVPLVLREHVVAFARRLCERAGLELERDKRRLLFAIHPGGPKILDHCRDALGLAEEQVAHARRVFYEHGNMSSATVPHILRDLVSDEGVRAGQRIVAMGFGPGLTATGAVFEKASA